MYIDGGVILRGIFEGKNCKEEDISVPERTMNCGLEFKADF
jgi:hypothetical protein